MPSLSPTSAGAPAIFSEQVELVSSGGALLDSMVGLAFTLLFGVAEDVSNLQALHNMIRATITRRTFMRAMMT
jgi:hypothetical protein